MFVQIIHMQAPIGEIANLRRLVAQEYLPALRNRPGFISAHLLEQIDNRDNAELVIYWDNHDSVEDANRTGVLSGSDGSIAARMPGLRIRRQSYIIKVAVENEPELQLSAV